MVVYTKKLNQAWGIREGLSKKEPSTLQPQRGVQLRVNNGASHRGLVAVWGR
jgi:hypothetical protein